MTTVQQRRDQARRRVRRERQLAAAAAVGTVLIAGGLYALSHGSSGVDQSAASSVPSPKPAGPPQLPRGGRTLLPTYRVVAYYGAPQDAGLGQLGIGSPAQAARNLIAQAAPYAHGGRPLQPAFELISTLVTAAPGDDGKYRYRQSDAVIDRYLAAARRVKALLILDIQPGHAGFLTESRHLLKWLRMPDVSLALDPEWHTPPGVIPGKAFGSVDAMEVNAVSFWLEGVVRAHHLPQKLLVVHRFTPGMITNEPRLKPRPDVAVTVNVDGFGTNVVKVAKYKSFAKRRSTGLHNGFKLFYHEDVHTMGPSQVLRVHPRPELVVYE
jgi:hypothetical protein